MKFKKSPSCGKCGRVESDDQVIVCPECGEEFSNADTRRLRSNGWLLAMIFAGVLVMLPAIFVWFLLYGHGFGYILLYIGFGLWLMASFFGRYYSGPNWLTACLISLPYVLLMGEFLSQALSFKHNYSVYGTHWSREFFVIPALTYVAPPFFAYLGSRCGSRRSAISALPFAFLFLLLIIGVVSMGPSKRSAESSESVSFRLTESADVQLWADVKCTYRMWKHYWEFRDLSEGGCGRMTLTVGRTNRELSLHNTINWTIDGVEHSRSIQPTFAPEDNSQPYPPGFDEAARWRTELPFEHLKNAKDVKIRWGSVQIDFGARETDRLKRLNEVLARRATSR